MTQKKNSDLNKIIRPYTFVLEEGRTIKNNYMDYTLKLLLERPQFISQTASPRKKKRPLRKRS